MHFKFFKKDKVSGEITQLIFSKSYFNPIETIPFLNSSKSTHKGNLADIVDWLIDTQNQYGSEEYDLFYALEQ